ncbi:MAG: DUF92 domain-containing protein [Bacillota bacterium]|nr:DUF92 domain-containing protein [Bacillota bacterium]
MALWFAEELRRHLRWPGNLGRSLPRLFLAAFVVPSLTFFSRWWTAALVPFLLLLLLYFAFFRVGRRSRRAAAPAARATLWFLGAYVLLLPVFWPPEYRYAAAVGLLAGTGLMLGGEVGEALWGSSRYSLFGRQGTLEGDLFALVTGFASLLLALVYLSELPVRQGVLLAVLLSLVGLLVRLVTPSDLGHFTVPVTLAGSLFLLSHTGAASPLLVRLLWGVALSGALAVLGLRWRALSPDGAAAAAGIGTFVLAFGGWGWAIPLVVFFLTSSALSRWKAGAKEAVRAVKGKEGARDAGQVLANGLVAAVAAALSLFFPDRAGLLFLAHLGAVAEAAADTWATEVGVLSAKPPRLILGGVQCPPGTSGGVTALGLWASAAGALLISLVGALLVGPPGPATAWRVAAPWVGGFGGALVDSLLGATLQAGYYCPVCAVAAETPRHGCGTATLLRRGKPWVDNDLVNLAGTLAGALLAAALAWLTGVAG